MTTNNCTCIVLVGPGVQEQPHRLRVPAAGGEGQGRAEGAPGVQDGGQVPGVAVVRPHRQPEQPPQVVGCAALGRVQQVPHEAGVGVDVAQPHQHDRERLALCAARRRRTRKRGKDLMVLQRPPGRPQEQALAECADPVRTLHTALHV